MMCAKFSRVVSGAVHDRKAHTGWAQINWFVCFNRCKWLLCQMLFMLYKPHAGSGVVRTDCTIS